MFRDKTFLFFWLIIFTLFGWAYSNHFHNPFQFDDDHTICSNQYIRNLKNIPLFFKDASTTSSLPANQAYRPGLTTLNAIDYWVSGKQADPDPFQFHISIFLSFLLLGVLLYFFFLKIFNTSFNHKWNNYFALFASAFFCLHTANAETINYIITRADSFSTLMVILAFVIYQYKPQWRNKLIYLLPLIIGLLVKEPTIMFAPLLFVYFFLFEQNDSSTNSSLSKKFYHAFKQSLPALILGMFFFIFSRSMTPPSWTSGGGKWNEYLITQTFVIVHYVGNFYLPLSLSADTDWTLIKNPFDIRVIIGVLFIFSLLVVAYKCSFNKHTRPITFGILWFFIALLPTSSVFPFAEVLNDHRVFFPYIGLVLATVCGIVLILVKYEERILTHQNKIKLTFICFLFLTVHAVGVHKRCEVWSSGESLWYDVTIKSPDNARGLMNYGNTLMAKGNYTAALDYYNRALKLWPNYSYLYVNIGVLKGATNNPIEAENNFKKALSLNGNNPECYFYYANWLKQQGRLNEAKDIVYQGLEVSPGHIGNKNLESEIYTLLATKGDKIKAEEEKAKNNPTAENYLNLSLVYFNESRFEDCITAAKQAILLNPSYAQAYNNVGAAYNILGKFDEAILACKKALELKPDFQLAANNLNDILNRRKKIEDALAVVKKQPTDASYLNLSYIYYTLGQYEKSIDAAYGALKLNPRCDNAYNNICSAYNVLKDWDKAIDAGEKGVAINPKNELLNNNLAVSRSEKAKQTRIK